MCVCVCVCVCVPPFPVRPKLIHEFAKKRFEIFKNEGDAVRKTIEVLQLLVPIRQACSIATVDISAVKQQLRDLARGIAVGGPAMGAAIAPSESFPQAIHAAFGSLKDECTICLELLEDAVQTECQVTETTAREARATRRKQTADPLLHLTCVCCLPVRRACLVFSAFVSSPPAPPLRWLEPPSRAGCC